MNVNNILTSVYLSLKENFNFNLRHLKRASEALGILLNKIEPKKALIEALKYGFTQTIEEEKIIQNILNHPFIKDIDLKRDDFKIQSNNVIPENLGDLIKIIAESTHDSDLKEVFYLLTRLISHKDKSIAIPALKIAFEVLNATDIRELILEEIEDNLREDWLSRRIAALALAEIYASFIKNGKINYLSNLERLMQKEDLHIQAVVAPIIASVYAHLIVNGKSKYMSLLKEMSKNKNQDIAQAAYKALEIVYLEEINKGKIPDLKEIECIIENSEITWQIMAVNTLAPIYTALIKKGKHIDFGRLEELLKSRYGGLKDAVVRALGKIYLALIQIGKEPELSNLEIMLSADDWRIRLSTANVLGRIYGELVKRGKKPPLEKLEALFKDRHGSVRKAAAEAIANVYLKFIEKGDKSGLKRLEKMLYTENWLLARVVSISLASIYSFLIQKGEMQYLPKLERMLEGDDFYVNIVTISSLATVYTKLIEDGRIPQLEKLENMLFNEDLYIRIAAASSLASVYSSLILKGYKEYLEDLEEMLSGEWYTKKAAATVLVNTYAHLIAQGERQYLRELERMIEAKDIDIIQAVSKVLGEVIKNIVKDKKEKLDTALAKIELLLEQKLSSPLKGSLSSEIEITQEKVRIGCLELERKNSFPLSACVFTESSFEILKTISLGYLLNHPVLLLGPTSTGKSFLIKWLANLLGYEHISYTLNPYSSKFELIGGIKPDKEGKFIWQDGIILKAVKEGKWLVLEEINLASSDVIEILNDYLTTGKFFYSENGQQKEIIPHPDFRLFATANPESYSQRQRLSEVFLSRWKIYYQKELSESEIAEILSSLFQIPASLALLIARFHKTVEKQSQARLIGKEEKDPYIYSLRDILRLGKRLKNKDLNSLKDLFLELYIVYLARIRNKTERDALIASLDAHFGFRAKGLKLKEIIEEQKENLDLKIEEIQVTNGDEFIPKKEAEIIPTYSQKVLLSQIVSAIIQAEPVLLVGMPASGKTTLIRYLAREKKTNLFYVNLSSDTGLEELLGGYVQDKTGKWYYKKGLLFRAIEEGSWLLIDEANLNPLSEYLNTLIDFGYIIDEEGKIHRAHPNFRLFLAINPPKIHASRNVLSPSLRSRFLEIWIEEVLKEEELEELVKRWATRT